MYCAIHIHLINYFTYNKCGNFGNLRSFFLSLLGASEKQKMKKCPHALYVKQLSKGVSIPPLLPFLAFWSVVFEIHPTGLSEHRVDRTGRAGKTKTTQRKL